VLGDVGVCELGDEVGVVEDEAPEAVTMLPRNVVRAGVMLGLGVGVGVDVS
jgi:hypothetical protein